MRSTTHEHILSVAATECGRFPAGTLVRLLDAGCGAGAMLAWLRERLPEIRPDLNFEFFGFDVSDHGVAGKRMNRTPGITQISIADPWPYPAGFFQIVVSNQVLEHVQNKPLFFGELSRTLADGAFSIHLFPLRHCIWEGHIHIPLAHRIRDAGLLRGYIRLASRLGIGRFPDHRRAIATPLDVFAREHADYIHFFTHYVSAREALDIARSSQLRASFRYTRDYYMRKLARLAGRNPAFRCAADRSTALDWLCAVVLRYVASVTLFLEKGNAYRHGTEERVTAGLAAIGDRGQE